MSDFQLQETELESELRGAEKRARAPEQVAAALERAAGGAGLEPADLALLWRATTVPTAALVAIAEDIRRRAGTALETFSPLYMTNTCDAECKMCGMRRDNPALRRETAAPEEVEEQLRVLHRRGMHAVSLLTGEYSGERRAWALRYVNRALRATQDLGFTHVLINVGSLDQEEFDVLLAGIERDGDGGVRAKLTMCTFQETYSRERYARFMGTDADNPRADYDRRLANFDRSRRAGLRVANPGVLLGLNPDLGFELLALARHARHLRSEGMDVYLSIPRLRQIAGGRAQGGVTDDDFVRLVSLLAIALPDCKVVLTTREDRRIQRRLVPVVAVLSAGSAAVTPYTDSGARFPLETSQFEVIDQRPFEEILGEHVEGGGRVANFDPA